MLLLYDDAYTEPSDVKPVKKQTYPPSIPVDEMYEGNVYPTGMEVEYKDDHMSVHRITSEEKRALERLHLDTYNDIRRAAEAHRQVHTK